jgi:hypothetical protein
VLPDGIFSNQASHFWVNFGVPWNGKGWYTFWPFGIYYEYLVYFGNLGAIWYIFRRFGICIVLRKIWQPWSGGFEATHFVIIV